MRDEGLILLSSPFGEGSGVRPPELLKKQNIKI